MPRFYTTPPKLIPYPYVLINANRPEQGISYIMKHKDVVEAVIVDAGVEIFRKPGTKEYPGGPEAWMKRLVSLWRRVKGIVPDAEVYVVVMDYPDDYVPGSLWLSEEITNIERTVENVKLALRRYPDVSWIIPVQGHYDDPESIVRCLELLREAGALDWAKQHTRYLAVASLCTSKKCSTIIPTIWNVRTWLSQHGYRGMRLHVFGPAASCIKNVSYIVYSWDSTAWTRPRAPNGSSAYSEEERAYLFLTWIHRYSDLIELPPHPRSMRKRLGIARARLGPR